MIAAVSSWCLLRKTTVGYLVTHLQVKEYRCQQYPVGVTSRGRANRGLMAIRKTKARNSSFVRGPQTPKQLMVLELEMVFLLCLMFHANSIRHAIVGTLLYIHSSIR